MTPRCGSGQIKTVRPKSLWVVSGHTIFGMSAGGATRDRQEVAAGRRIWLADPFPQRDQQARRFPVLAPTKSSTKQNEVRINQRYDAVATPHNKPSRGRWFVRAFSPSPDALISRPEDVTVMRQSQAEAWRVLGHRFRAAHGSRSSHLHTSCSPLLAGRVAATRTGRIGPLFSRQLRRACSERGR